MSKLRIGDHLSLPLDWMSLATVVYGARGAGKTTLGRVIAEEVHRAGQRFCAIDLKGDWWGLKAAADGRSEGLPVVIFGGDHADLPLEEGAGEFVAETIAGLEQSAILDFEHFSKGKQIKFQAAFFERLYHRNRDPLLLLADEAQRYAPQAILSGSEDKGFAARCLGAVQDLVKLGRKHGIGVVLFTQRGSSLSKEVAELCDLLVAFRTPGPLDQTRVKEWLDANATKEERETVMSLLSGLATGTAIFASGHPGLKLFQVAAVRQPETFDSSATPKIGQRRREPRLLAQPDLDALRSKMAAAIERAKAEDPRELRKRIGELEREVRGLKTETGKRPAVEVRVERVEVPVLKDAQVARLEKAVERVAAVAASIASSGESFGAAGREIAKAMAAIRAPPPLDTPAPRPPSAGVAALPRREAAPRPPKQAAVSSNGRLAPGEARVLTAIAQQEQDGAIREQVTVLTGYKRSTRDLYIQRLKAAGMVEELGSLLFATDAGVASLGAGYEPLPTGEGLRSYWLGRLPVGERRILEILVDAYPAAVERAALEEAAGYKRSTRDLYIQRLTSRRLVEAVGPGEVRASEKLF